MNQQWDCCAPAGERMPETSPPQAHSAHEDDTHSSASQPRRVTRGERSTDPIEGMKAAAADVAHIDWFACTFTPSSHQFFDVFASVFVVPREFWRPRAGGWQGYESRIDLSDFGILAYGGDTQRGTAHLELNGHGCARITDWNAVRLWCETYGVRITRVDLAHDDFKAESVSIGKALAWLHEGRFGAGGRSPSARLIDDLGSNKGKTLYVGQRQNGKLCRIYEKGKQQGDPLSCWCRVEVEFRGKSRLIPLEVLTRPGAYLAGAYPCLEFLTQHQDKIRTLSMSSTVNYEHLIRCVRMQYGTALTVMVKVEGGDAFAVLNQVMRPGMPRRLANLPLPRGESCQDSTT